MFKLLSFGVLTLGIGTFHAQAQFPNSIATDSTLLVAVNNAQSTLRYSIGSGDTTIIFPPSATFVSNSTITIGAEIIKIGTFTASTGTATSCTRGYESTTAAAHSAGSIAKANITANYHNNSRTEIKSIETALGINLSNIAGNSLHPSSYTFSLSTPGVALVGGSVNLYTPIVNFPAGIKASSVNLHKLRIVDAIAGNEIVMISGVNPGVSFTFTPALSHAAGNWTINSATSGIQEVVKVAESGVGKTIVSMDSGVNRVYATTYLVGNPGITIMGGGSWTNYVYMDSTFTSGDIFSVTNSSSITNNFINLHVTTSTPHTSGACMHFKDGSYVSTQIVNVRCEDTYVGIDIENTGGITATGFQYVHDQLGNPSAHAGVWVHGGRGGNIIFNGGLAISEQTNSPNMLDFGFLIESADGIAINNFLIRAEIGLGIFGTGTNRLSSILVSNTFFDVCRNNAVQIASSVPGQLFNNFVFNGNHFSGTMQSVGGLGQLVFAGAADMTYRIGLSFTNNYFIGGNNDGIYLNNVAGAIISGNQFIDLNTGNAVGVAAVRIVNGRDIPITGNEFVNTPGGSSGFGVGHITNGIILSGALVDYLMVSGNVFQGMEGLYINNFATSVTNSNIGVNAGQANTSVTVASASTMAIPVHYPSFFFISGTTTVNTITGCPGNGQRFNAITTGAVSFTGGNMGRAFGPTVAGQTITLLCDVTGGKVYVN